MNLINNNNLRNVIGGAGAPITLEVCQTGKIVDPSLTTADNVFKGLSRVLQTPALGGGFNGIDILIAGNNVPGSNPC